MRNKFFNSLFLFLIALGCAVPSFAALEIRDDYRSPRNKERSVRKATNLIVLHTTEAHAKSSLNKLSERGEAHYCITEKGEIYRIIDKEREAFHAGRSMWNAKEECDEYSIGIEVVGYHDKSMPLKQLAAIKDLVAQLKKIYKLQDSQVVCHSHVAYGAPNTWHKKKHRGRKRCGMLFAMPSVRTRLGLRYRPAYDPDVRANRLVQADSYLNSILYGNVDTMTSFYGSGRTQISAAQGGNKVDKPGVKPNAKPVAGSAAKPVTKPVSKPVSKPISKPAAKQVAKPIVRPQVVTGTSPNIPPPSEETKTVSPAENEDSDWLRTIGLKGGYFKKKAKLVLTEKEKAKGDEAAEEANDKPLPLPQNLHIRKMGDDVKDLSALANLPGYVRGGPVSAELSPYKIAGAAWRLPTTYYYNPRGTIVTGDKVDEKSVEAGTFIFYKK